MKLTRNIAFMILSALVILTWRVTLSADSIACGMVGCGGVPSGHGCTYVGPGPFGRCTQGNSSFIYACTTLCDQYGGINPDTYHCDDIDGGECYCRDYSCPAAPQPSPPENQCQSDEECSPIVISLDAGVPQFSDARAGVLFDLAGGGTLEWVGWPVDPTGTAWLAFDRNGNGSIDNGTELFGNRTPLFNGGLARNGYEALGEFDSNHDGWVDDRDSGFTQLRFWLDVNRDGRSTAAELHSLQDAGVARLSVEARRANKQDRWGNRFLLHARVVASPHVHIARASWDVYPVVAPAR